MFNVGDKIVYPMHGAGTITAIEEKDILGQKQSYYILKAKLAHPAAARKSGGRLRSTNAEEQLVVCFVGSQQRSITILAYPC